MNIQQLQYIIEVNRLHSISAAAKELYLTQPSLSSAIKQLEDELHIEIFKRTRWGVEATPEGIDFIKRAEEILDRFLALERRYFFEEMLEGELSITAMPCKPISDAFKIFCKSNEDIAQLKFSMNTELGNEVLLYFSKNQKEEYLSKVDLYGLEFIPLVELKTFICLNEENNLAKKEEMCLEDLKDYAVVIDQTCLFLDTVNILLRSIEPNLDCFQYPKIISTNLRELQIELLKSTKAFFVGTSLDIGDLKGKGIASIPTVENPYLELGYIKRKGRDLTYHAKQFLDIFISILDIENKIT